MRLDWFFDGSDSGVRGDLQQLTQAIEAIERRNGGGLSAANPKRSATLPTTWRDVDQTLGGGLQRGAMHEWFSSISLSFRERGGVRAGCKDGETQRESAAPLHDGKSWFPPLAIFIHLAWQSIDQCHDDCPIVIWIGRRCWPHLRAMVRSGRRASSSVLGRRVSNSISGRRVSNPPAARAHNHENTNHRALLESSLFIDPPDDAARLWAIDLSLRSMVGGIVIADGSRLDMPATRRLQLAAEAGRSIALIARPPHELNELSAAATRWIAQPTTFHHADTETQRKRNGIANDAGDASPLRGKLEAASQSFLSSLRPLRLCGETSPRWIVQLLRCKGLRPTPPTTAPAHNTWAVEWNSAQGCINQLADVVDRPDSPPLAPRTESDDFIASTSAIAARRSA